MYTLEFRDIVLFLRGYTQRAAAEWQRTRFVAWMTYRMNTSEKHPKTMEQLLPLYGDKKVDRGARLSPDDVARIMKLHSAKK
jgi:hypothetical protein